MTRKDYVLIARAFEISKPQLAQYLTQTAYEAAKKAWQASVVQMAVQLETTNHRFDCGRFVTACHSSNS